MSESSRPTSCKILISGASGFVGQGLLRYFNSIQGYEVWKLVRQMKSLEGNDIFWDPYAGTINKEKLEEIKFDVVIHLTGENVVGIWTQHKKDQIKNSRAISTKFLVDTLSSLHNKPSSFLCASGISFYGNDTKGGVVDEESPKGFLSDVTSEWENEANQLQRVGVRVVNMRFSNILDPSGGLLGFVLLPFKCFLGGVLGDGSQQMSWITLHDVARAVEFIIQRAHISGPVNFATPNPVSNYEFTKTLGRVLGRPTVAWVPGFLLHSMYYVLGEYEALLSSIKIYPSKLAKESFTFTDVNLESALRRMISL